MWKVAAVVFILMLGAGLKAETPKRSSQKTEIATGPKSQNPLPIKTELETLLSDLKYEDRTPLSLSFNPALADYWNGRIVLSKAVDRSKPRFEGCRGEGLYLADAKGALQRLSTNPDIDCIVDLKAFEVGLYIHTRNEKGDRLLLGTLDTERRLQLKTAIDSTFDGARSHDASARIKWKLDRLRLAGATNIRRNSDAKLLIHLESDRVDLLWLLVDGPQYLCLRDSISLPEGSFRFKEPEVVPGTQPSRRLPSDFTTFDTASTIILWEGNRREMGRIEISDGKRTTTIGSDTIIDPPLWTQVPSTGFSIRIPGNIVMMKEGFLNFETSRAFTFDDPFVYYFQTKDAQFHRLPYLSNPDLQILWIRAHNDGLLISFLNGEGRPQIAWLSPKANGPSVNELGK